MRLEGRYTNADIFAQTVEEGVYAQVYDIINCKAFEGKKVILCPDVHVGKSGPCGLVAEIGDYVCPEHVSVDIGCSVSMSRMSKRLPEELYAEFEHKVKKAVPMGFTIHDKTIVDEKAFRKFLSSQFSKYKAMQPDLLYNLPDSVTEEWITSVLSRIGMDEKMFWHSLGTAGGGNHFVELDSDGKNDIIALHFGSRNFGLKVCEYWTNIANSVMKLSKKDIGRITTECRRNYIKEHGKLDKNFEVYLRSELLKAQNTQDKIQGYLDGDNMRGYLCDMVFAQSYAKFNHVTVQNIIEGILKKYGIKFMSSIYTTHNYIDFRDFTMRKSAISANSGELVIIPFNMRDGIAVCEGLGNADWLNSAPHGAGRKMSRSVAKKTLNVKDFENTMKGIYSTTVCQGTIDEAPMAYKDTDEIVKQIDGTTVKILELYKPVINIKAVDAKRPWEK